MIPAEFPYPVAAHEIGGAARTYRLTASAEQRASLARRFDLLALDRLEAELAVRRDTLGIAVTGRVRAAGAQACVVSGEPAPFDLDEDVDVRFSDSATPASGDEVELTAPDLELLPLEGDTLDLGEVAAQSLGLGLDPYPRAPEAVRAAAQQFVVDEEAARLAANPFSVLKR